MPPRTIASRSRSRSKRAPSLSKPEPKAPKAPLAAPFDFEFGGPLGALGTMVALPLLIIWLSECALHGNLLPYFPSPPSTAAIVSTVPYLFLYIATGIFLALTLPGPRVAGTLIKDTVSNKEFTLTYLINGHLQFWLTLALLPFLNTALTLSPVTLTVGSPTALLAQLGHTFLPSSLAVIIASIALSTYLFVTSYFPNRTLAHGGTSGNPVYDFFLGRELNPRLGGLDLKVFCELRPGLVGWVLLNVGHAAMQVSGARGGGG